MHLMRLRRFAAVDTENAPDRDGRVAVVDERAGDGPADGAEPALTGEHALEVVLGDAMAVAEQIVPLATGFLILFSRLTMVARRAPLSPDSLLVFVSPRRAQCLCPSGTSRPSRTTFRRFHPTYPFDVRLPYSPPFWT